MKMNKVNEVMRLIKLKSINKKSMFRETISRNKGILLVAAAYFIISTAWLLSLHYNFLTSGYDLGQYVQMYWNTVNGNGLLTSDLRVRPGNPDGFYFWEHFSPILLVFVPFFSLVPRPETLLVIKTMIIALSIPALWFMARKGLSKELSAFVVLSYILNPFLLRAVSFDFQEQIVLPLIIFIQFYFFFGKKYKQFVVTTIIGLTVNEYSAALSVVALLSVAVMRFRSLDCERYIERVRHKEVSILLILAIISLTYFITVTSIMQLNSETGIIVGGDGERESAIGYVTGLLSTPEVLSSKITNHLEDKLASLNTFLMSAYYIPLLSTIALVPLILYTIFGWLVDYPSFYQFGNHHALYTLPYLYLGLVLALKDISVGFQTKGLTDAAGKSLLKVAIVVSLILFSIQISYFIERDAIPIYNQHNKELHQILKLIPDNASILTQNNIYPHISTRNKAYIKVDDTRYNQMLQVKSLIDFEYIIIDEKNNWASPVKPVINTLMKYKEIDYYGVYIISDGIIVLKRDYYGQPNENYDNTPFKMEFTGTELYFRGDKVNKNTIVHPAGYNDKTFWFGPYVLIPSGNYKVTFEMMYKGRTTRNNELELIRLDVAKNKGDNILSEKRVYLRDVGTNWTNISLNFSTNTTITDTEFRGMNPSPDVDIYLKQITVEEIVGEE